MIRCPQCNAELREPLTYDEAAELLGQVSERTVRNLIDSGEIERIYIRSMPRITRSSVVTYIERMRGKNGSLNHPA
ncbi:MAG: helix-turn-helix domain-containing protein [Terriglobia bacterium]